ncbi:MAG: hypothetical protein OZ928_08075 [Polyangiaceae bacterium]|nr:hypothetical protein [Polyangiaceae bacterium]
MAGLKITKGGRSIPLNRLADEIMSDVRKAATVQIEQQVRARLERIRCPVHGKSFRSISVAMAGDAGRIRVEPCCEETSDAVERAVAGV